MKLLRCISSVLAWLTLLPRVWSEPASTNLLQRIEAEVTAVFERTKAAIVRIDTEAPGPPERAHGIAHRRIGTGFFIEPRGRVLTAASVVGDAATCWIEWQSHRFTARVLGRDPLSNVAVLETDWPAGSLSNLPPPALAFGDSDAVRVGSLVIAVGYAYGISPAPAFGVVNGIEARCTSRVFPVSHFRAACPVRPGQGGGPLLNADGAVIGLIVAGQGRDGCYALPTKAIQRVLPDLADCRDPQYAWVGLGVADHAPAAAGSDAAGGPVIVQQVFPDTPAARAGFAPRDVVVRIGTNTVSSCADVLNAMFYHRAGDSIPFTVLRAGSLEQITVTAASRPPDTSSVGPAPLPPPVLPANATR